MSGHHVVHLRLTPELVQFLTKRAPKGKLNGQTIHDDGEGNLVGYISEEIMLDIFTRLYKGSGEEIQYVADESTQYDILIGKHKVDIKSKMRTSMIRPDYDVSIAEYTISHQQCDTYAFCSITFTRDKKTPLDFYFMGVMKKADFLKAATVLKKGQPDGDNILPNGQPFIVRKDCRNMKCRDLKQFEYEQLKVLEKAGYDLIEW